MVWKKVNNSDPGTANLHGGDSTDKISDLFSGVDVDDVDINADFTVRSSKRFLRNPANTFSYQEIASAITANRTITEPLLTGNDTRVYQAHPQTLTGKTISGASNTLSNIPVNSLSNFAISSPITDQIIKYNGTNWINATDTGGTGGGGGMSAGGSVTGSGNGAIMVFTITHGLSPTPDLYFAIPASDDAIGNHKVTVTSTQIVITYAVPPPGTGSSNNLSFVWGAGYISETSGGTSTYATRGGPIYTGVIAGTTVKLINNISGNVDYTADNTVNAVTAINSAAANIQNIANIDPVYGGDIQLTAGVYKCTTSLDLSKPTTNRYGIKLRGGGKYATVLNMVPASALTDGIKLRGTGNSVTDLRIKTNANVVNLIHITSEPLVAGLNNEHRGGRGSITDVEFEGVNWTDAGGFTPTAGQVGILHETNTSEVAFYWRIDQCSFKSMDTAIKSTGAWATSLYITNCDVQYAGDYAIDLNDAQHMINNLWIQGYHNRPRYGIRLRGGTEYNHIHNVIAEILSDTQSAAAILLDAGARHNYISNIINHYSAIVPYDAFTSVIEDNSGNSTNHIEYYSSAFERTVHTAPMTLNTLYSTGSPGINLRTAGLDQFLLIDMRPSHTAVSTSRLGSDFRLHNVDNNTNDEYIEVLTLGTSGYFIQAVKTGTGVVRDIKIRANGIDALILGGTTSTVSIGNGIDVPLGTTTGTKIGTAATQKMGFYGKTPIVQPTAITSPTLTTPTANETALKTAIDTIRTALTNLGLTA